MRIGRGRIIKAEQAEGGAGLRAAVRPPAGPRILRRALAEAHAEADELLARARAEADEIRQRALRDAAEVALAATTRARAEAEAEVAAQALALARLREEMDDRALERSIGYARLLAERLLGSALELDSETIVRLARQVLAEARAARRATILAHPADAQVLSERRTQLGLDTNAIEIIADPERTRGNLRIETDLGLLDAALSPRLDQLSAKLAEWIKP